MIVNAVLVLDMFNERSVVDSRGRRTVVVRLISSFAVDHGAESFFYFLTGAGSDCASFHT